MKKYYNYLIGLARYVVIPISIFALFKKGIDKILGTYLVEPILSICSPPNIIFDLAISLLIFCVCIPLYSRLFKGAKVPNKIFFLSLTVLTFYLTYRISSTPFNLTNTAISSRIKLLDIIFLIPLSIIISYGVNLFSTSLKKETVPINNMGFTIDEPIKISESNDLLNRNKFIDLIVSKIKNTETKNVSFAIGIIAKWGSGKTTFINSLLEKLPSEDMVKIELNVWKCSNNSQIVETLFAELKKALSKYSLTINNKIKEYATTLIKGSKNDGLNGIKNLVDIITPIDSLAKQYEDINKEIKYINKKIVIVIDDLDRLDKKEIYEVIRLIRNTANFANTFFIAAYDRNYILNAIEEINSYQVHYFLEKIFQIEFSLPSISNEILQNEIRIRIEPFLVEIDKEGFKKLQGKEFDSFEFGVSDLTALYIFNIRDVVRFVNSFKLSYEFVKGEICFPDFYNLELIKFKHPDLFSMIYKDHYNFFTTDKESIGAFDGSSNTYTLKMVLEDGQITNTSNLRKFIDSNRVSLKLSDKDISIICSSFSSIFPDSHSIFIPERNAPNDHLAVTNPSTFDRYFILGIEGSLSEIEFSKMRQMPVPDFLALLEDWAIDKGLSYELEQRFHLIQDFDNKDDFKKIITGIFHLANLSGNDSESHRHNFLGYNSVELSKIIGNERNIKLFENENEYKEFLFSFLKSNGEKYKYTDQYLRGLILKSYINVGDLFQSDELTRIAVDNFKNSLCKHEKFTYDLWLFFLSCIESKENVSNHQIKPQNTNEEALTLMRKFICQKDIDSFLEFAIRPANGDSERSDLHGCVKHTFKSAKLFVYLLKKFKGQSKYKEEFLAFYDLLTNDLDCIDDGVPNSFFKIIPINNHIKSIKRNV